MIKKMMKCSMVGLTLLFIVGCTVGSVEVEGPQKRAVLVTDSGGANDKSFNQGTNEGLMFYASMHPEDWMAMQAIESKSPQDFGPNLNNAADENDLVITAGYLIQKDLLKAAKRNPDRKFIGIDIDISGIAHAPKNLETYFFAEEQTGFLAGVAAGLQTKTNKVGYLGGEEVPAVQRFGWGFIAGVHAVNAQAVISYEYTNSFNDVALGTQKAQAMYNTGVDVIFIAAGGTGAGAIQETVSQRQAGKDVWIIGVDRDQYEDGRIPGTDQSVVLTSAMKKVDQAAAKALKDITNGTFLGGRTIKLSIKDGAVGLPDKNPNMSAAMLAKIAQIEEALKTDKIIVPTDKEAVDSRNVVGRY